MKLVDFRPSRVTLVTAVTLIAVALLCTSAAAQAASPSWDLLAVTGPSNLPPRQSEVQRLTIEAEGGSFELGRNEKVSTAGQPIFSEARLGLTAGSAIAKIESVVGPGQVEPGDRISTKEPGYEGTTIVSCSSDNCVTAGSTLELSEPATVTESGALRLVYTRELELVADSEAPRIGDEIVKSTNETGQPGLGAEFFPPGTTVTSVGAHTFTLSNPTTQEYNVTEGYLNLTTPAELAGPISYGASAAAVQQALEALPAYGHGSVTVEGSGTAEHPYVIAFAGEDEHGPFALQNVPQLEIVTTALKGGTASANVFTTVPGGFGTGEIVVFPANIGGAPARGTTTLRIGPLPAGIEATGQGGSVDGGWTCTEATGSATIICSLRETVPALKPTNALRVPIKVLTPTTTNVSLPVEISGGGAESDSFQLPVIISAAPAPFATRAIWAGALDSDGKVETQAAAHPASVQAFFVLNTVRSGSGRIVPAGVLKNADVDLPPGLIGNPIVTPRCPQEQLASIGAELERCNAAMRVGKFGPLANFLAQGVSSYYVPIFNDVPAKGSAAEFTTQILFPFQSLLGSVRSSEDFGVRVTAPNIPNVVKVYGSYAAFEGEPAGAKGKAFLTNASDCASEAQGSPGLNLSIEAYEFPGVLSSSPVSFPPVTGCDKLQFSPSFAFAPSTTQGSSPSGASADLHIPQEGLTDPNQLAQPDLKKAVVTLPEGLTLNPSAANGLASCSEKQIGYVGPGAMPNPTRFDEEPVTCPDASKLGTVQIETPLVDETEEELHGTIYLAAQEENPFDSLLAVYLVVESERFGVKLKLPGKVEPDPRTGQLTATFDNNPQLPFEDLKLNFRGGGPRSTFATPEVCGNYKTTGSLEPWSAPESGPPTQISEGGFDVQAGCASSSGARLFGPTLEAGTVGIQAGDYSPLVIKVARKDGEQELKSLDFSLPKGLLGKVAGIPYCPEASIRAAEGRSGKAEQASPSCPAASRIGTVDAAAGVGGEPIHVGGSVYLAGPYRGAPLSAVVVTPAVAGPFDLGDVVIRTPLYVDPETAEITAKSDPIPTILRGIPLKLRSVAIDLDRPDFSLNPTSCNPMLVTASILGSNGQVAKPQNRFQVGGCSKLKFKPSLKISLKGSTTRSGHPALKAVLTYPKKGSYANIRRAQVNLPHSEFLAQANLNKTCTKPVLLEGNCPKSTIYGRARAWTPLLDKPLQGPVYLVGGYGYKLPALVADLNGQIRVVLKGKVDTGRNRGIRNTFETVPDAPVSRFVLQLKGGKKYGLLENSEDLCKEPQRAIARLASQNGLVSQFRTRIANQCGKKPKKQGKKAT